MADLVVRLNGEPVKWRPFAEAEEERLLAVRERMRARYKELEEQGRKPKGWRPWFGTPFFAFLFVDPAPGDEITCDRCPEGYDEVWIRFKASGSRGLGPALYNMKITP